MSLSTYFLEYGRHVARFRRRAYAPRAIPLAMINIRKILHGFPFLSHDAYGAPLGGPSGRRSSAIRPKTMCKGNRKRVAVPSPTPRKNEGRERRRFFPPVFSRRVGLATRRQA